jgi:hypothetical protein
MEAVCREYHHKLYLCHSNPHRLRELQVESFVQLYLKVDIMLFLVVTVLGCSKYLRNPNLC